ncbi:MAG TPA: SDR family NAD(P)-dependent oxidoreductase [Methylomirabilota bacterium]|jgi:3-oxoacyl-[acyl-carrier protein] reductase|nr:SDR family NAD(P)-dependent oxidoreductase [Methylomirabilota bacterium]
MDLGLRGKAAVVTGASRGLGRAIAIELGREGCRIGLCARGKEALEAAAAEVRALGVEAVAVGADVTTEPGVRDVIDTTLAAFGRIDVLVNNVGGSTGTSFQETSVEDWQRAVDLNLIPAVRASRLVVPHMRARGNGAIVNIVSIYGREWGGAYVRRPTYMAAKAAEIAMSKALALELAPQGIRVNAVAPGSILFPGGGWERRVREDPEGIAAFMKADLPLGRFGRAEEVGRVVAFLASDAASLVTGACLNVDGGQSRSLI